MFTAKMIQLFAIALEKDSKAVTEAILREGVMQFISVYEFQPKAATAPIAAPSHGTPEIVSELRKRVEGFLHTGGIIPTMPKESDLNQQISIDFEKETDHLNKIDGQRERLRQQQMALQQEAIRLEDIKRQLHIYGPGIAGTTIPGAKGFINTQTGKLPVKKVAELNDALKGMPALNLPLGLENDTAFQLLIWTKRDNEQIAEIMANVGWTKIELAGELTADKKNLAEEIDGKLKIITDQQKEIQLQINQLILYEEKYLHQLWIDLRIKELCNRIETNFQTSARTVLFAGWLPTDKQNALANRIIQATQNRCYMEWYEAGSSQMIGQEVPIVLNNPKFLAPFQLLVSNFGIPQYGTIDPTPFVMPIYLTMFGLMFPDVGQGLVLLILGILGVLSLRKKEEHKNFYQIAWLVNWCGLSSITFGALFGSYFGFELFEPIWFNFHGIILGHPSGSNMVKSIYDILAITLYFGITVIAIGLIFNWINLVKTKNWMELIFDKGGLLGGWIYAGGINIAFYMVAHQYKGMPDGKTLFFLAGLPALLLFIKEPLHYFKHAGGHGNIVGVVLNFVMFWIVELLEIFAGYLSNTLSFMRVAGLGIAHVCLMIAFFILADMAGGGIVGVLILIFGNILVIALEGLSAGIQALRLNYYEFFTKFFHGTGKLHTPISLNSKF